VREAQSQRDTAKLEYDRMKKLFSEEVIPKSRFDDATNAYRVASEGLRRAKENLSLAVEGPRKEDVRAAEAQAAQANADLELAQTRLAYGVIRSPVDGVVLVRPTEPGEVVQPGSTVLTLAEIGRPWVRCYLAETDLARVRLGQKATVTTDTYPDKSYPGVISYVSSKAEFTPKAVETHKERVTLVYRMKVRVANPRFELKPGMPADVEIRAQ
jgi:HlyD family secretion protein